MYMYLYIMHSILFRETPNKGKHILMAVKSSAPMWILGMIRTIFISVTGFHVHEAEYGVHWNFFFTLAFVRVSKEKNTCAKSTCQTVW
jgi:hypothetical protein